MNKARAIAVYFFTMIVFIAYSAENNEVGLIGHLHNLQIADLNQKDFDDLNDAINQDDDNAVRRLLDKGVIDGNSWANNNRDTLLMMVAGANKKRVTSLLLSYDNTDVNMSDVHGWTALMYAASNDMKDVIDLLIKKGANINARNNVNRTALIIAACANEKDNITTLLSYDNLNVNIWDVHNLSALDYIIFHYNQQQEDNEKKVYAEIVHRLLNYSSSRMNLNYPLSIV